MPVNQSIVEVVRFTEKGVDEVVAQIKVMNRETDEVVKRYTALLGLANNPTFVKHAAWLERMAKSHELIGMRLRNQAYAQRMADGSAARQLRTAEQLNREYAKMRRETEYVARYGEAAGKFLARYGAPLAGLGRFAAGASLGGVATVGGLAHQGFQGTVEKARFDNEVQLLSREVAGIFKPLMVLATRAAAAARRAMEKSGRSGQDAMMLAGVGITSGLALGFGIGGRFGARVGLGAAGLGVMAGGIAGEKKWMGAAGGAALGYSVGGGLGAVAGGTIGYAASLGDYGRARRKGYSKVGAGIRAGVAGFLDLPQNILADAIPQAVWGKSAADKAREWMGIEKGPEPREAKRRVMIAGGGFEEQGAGFHRLNAAVSKLEGGGGSDDDELGPMLGKMLNVLEKISAKLGDDAELERSGADA